MKWKNGKPIENIIKPNIGSLAIKLIIPLPHLINKNIEKKQNINIRNENQDITADPTDMPINLISQMKMTTFLKNHRLQIYKL